MPYLRDASDDTDWDARRGESPLVFGRRHEHTRRERREEQYESEARRVGDLWRVVRPEKQHKHDVLHEDHEVLAPRAHWVAAQHVVDRARHVEQHLHVERRRREPRDVFGAQDLEDLRQLEDQAASDDRVAERLAHHELDACDVGKVVLGEERVEARGREHAEHKLRALIGAGGGGGGNDGGGDERHEQRRRQELRGHSLSRFDSCCCWIENDLASQTCTILPIAFAKTKERIMNQNDFRALLSAKSSGDGSGRSGSGGGKGGGGGFGGKRNMTESDLEEIRKLSKKPKKKGKKPVSGKGRAGDDDNEDATGKKSAGSMYRDRAAERRQGVNSDMIDADEYAHFDTEQTKFLGGDMEHTHLVKGLDFALLSQLKREKEKLQQATSAAQKQQQQNSSSNSYGQENNKSTSSLSEKLTFKSRVGRLVYFHAVQSSAVSSMLSSSRASEHFLPGRMYYTFNLNASEIESVPVIVQRSKEDCPEPDDVVSGMVSELVISRVGEALSNSSKRHSGAGGGVKKLRKKKKYTEAAENDGNGADGDDDEGMFAELKSTGAADPDIQDESDDEDIFPEVGEYIPIHARAEETEEEETKASHLSHPESTSTPGYFSNLSASISAAEQAEKKREEEAEHAWKQTIRKVVATQSQAEREKKERERQAKEAQAGMQIDEYSECYPEYQAGAALDSEDDEEKPRKGVDKDDVTAEDAATEKTRRRKQKQGNKLQNDLEKINKILETKK